MSACLLKTTSSFCFNIGHEAAVLELKRLCDRCVCPNVLRHLPNSSDLSTMPCRLRSLCAFDFQSLDQL